MIDTFAILAHPKTTPSVADDSDARCPTENWELDYSYEEAHWFHIS